MIILDLSLATYDVKKAIYSLAINDTDTALAVVEVSLLVLSLNFPLQARSVFTQKAGVRYISQSKNVICQSQGSEDASMESICRLYEIGSTKREDEDEDDDDDDDVEDENDMVSEYGKLLQYDKYKYSNITIL